MSTGIWRLSVIIDHKYDINEYNMTYIIYIDIYIYDIISNIWILILEWLYVGTYLCFANILIYPFKCVFSILAPWLSAWFWDLEESQDIHQWHLEYFRCFVHCPLHDWPPIKVCSRSSRSRPPRCSLACQLTCGNPLFQTDDLAVLSR